MFALKYPHIEAIVEGRIKTSATISFLQRHGISIPVGATTHEFAFNMRRYLWTLSLVQLKSITEAA